MPTEEAYYEVFAPNGMRFNLSANTMQLLNFKAGQRLTFKDIEKLHNTPEISYNATTNSV